MSRRVKERLRLMRVLEQTTHEDRVELDRRIEEKTGKYCDDGVDELTNEEIMELLRAIWVKKKKKKKPIAAVV
ncbi:unnamed protein product [marine sediment metagenome]|uniref:Uncharacterized protein n=1 Tax=marine sediment metagenome TaxID=412755 RepID=X1R7A6_9ZZZZ